MRRIFDHVVTPADGQIALYAVDEPGPGAANHAYTIEIGDNATAGSPLLFQNGPIGEVGLNGISNEVLLAIVIDRLRGFQRGPFNCRENALALTKLEEGMHWMHSRTLERMRRGVEGSHRA